MEGEIIRECADLSQTFECEFHALSIRTMIAKKKKNRIERSNNNKITKMNISQAQAHCVTVMIINFNRC